MGGSGQKLKKESWMANERTQAYHKRMVAEVDKPKYPDFKTYDIETLQIVNYREEGGYQVTFWCKGDNYTPEEYARLVNEFLQYVDGHVTHIGKYNGAEISFHIMDKRTALRLGRKYNQISVWDWAKAEEILTGGTGRRDRNGNPV